MSAAVLVVDDEPQVAEFCRMTLEDAGHRVTVAHSATEALSTIDDRGIDIVLSDVRMPGMTGTHLLQSLAMLATAPDVILMTAYGNVSSAVEAVRLGAFDYLEKPFTPDRLQTTVQRLSEIRRLRLAIAQGKYANTASAVENEICGASRAMVEVFNSIIRLADRTHPVLITGETGTGKELVARAVHDKRLSANRPFVAVDCGALSPSLVESELFGHVRGAFTSALGDRRGLLESSAGGTLFLDEIGELPLELQSKLLRVLQSREFRPLGSNTTRRLESRVIAATNRDLEKAVAEGTFRADLFYRLNVYPIPVPPLRARKGDIPLLAQHFIDRHGEGRVVSIAPEALAALSTYHWPGNVRELESCILRMISRTERRVLEAADIPPCLTSPPPSAAPASSELEQAERRVIEAALNAAAGNVGLAAQRLGLSQATLYRKISIHGLKPRRSGHQL
jgi:DNA-binding NtrC family response regulator